MLKNRMIKSLTAMMAAVVMLLNLSLVASAQPDLNPPYGKCDDVSLTIHKYINSGDDEPAGNPAGGPRPNEGAALANVPYTIQKAVYKGSGDPTDLDNYDLVGPIANGRTDATGTLVFSSSPGAGEVQLPGSAPFAGIYVFTEQPNGVTGLTSPASYLVSLPMQDPIDQDEWICNVHVYPKPEEPEMPEFKKDGELIENGQIAKWNFEVEIKEGIKDATLLRITDVLDPRLLFLDPPGVTGTYDAEDGTVKNLVPGTHFTYTLSGQTLVIQMTAAGFELLGGALDDSEDLGDGKVGGNIYFEFQTEVKIDSLDDLGTITNGGTLEYNTGEREIPDPEKPEVDVYGLKVLKVDTDGIALEGAEFDLYADEDINPDGSIKDGATPVASGVSGPGGIIEFFPLEEGTYWLVETKAPEGFKLLDRPLKVEVGENWAEDFVVEVTVTNTTDFTLPITGGAGTLMFTIIGLLLIAASVVFAIAYRKKVKNSNAAA